MRELENKTGGNRGEEGRCRPLFRVNYTCASSHFLRDWNRLPGKNASSNSKGVRVGVRGASEKNNYHASFGPSPNHLPLGAPGAPLRSTSLPVAP